MTVPFYYAVRLASNAAYRRYLSSKLSPGDLYGTRMVLLSAAAFLP